MTMKILFATSNGNKLREVREILGSHYEIVSLADINWFEEIPEPFDSIEQNAIYKAKYFFEKTGLSCISEDSGLEVSSLDNRPGAFSARYAGLEKNDVNNYQKVLAELEGITEREARFVSVFVLYTTDSLKVFRGEMDGSIVDSPRGENGFGYDPIFMANGQSKTNAELTSDEKNAISHRKKALMLVINYIKNNSN